GLRAHGVEPGAVARALQLDAHASLRRSRGRLWSAPALHPRALGERGWSRLVEHAEERPLGRERRAGDAEHRGYAGEQGSHGFSFSWFTLTRGEARALRRIKRRERGRARCDQSPWNN